MPIDASRFSEFDYKALARARSTTRIDAEYYDEVHYPPIDERIIEFAVAVFNFLLDDDKETARPRMMVWRNDFIVSYFDNVITMEFSMDDDNNDDDPISIFVLDETLPASECCYDFSGHSARECADRMLQRRRDEERPRVYGLLLRDSTAIQPHPSSTMTRLSALGYRRRRPENDEDKERTQTDWTRARTLELPRFPGFLMVVDRARARLPFNIGATALCASPSVAHLAVLFRTRRRDLARELVAMILERPGRVYGDAFLYRRDHRRIGNETFYNMLAEPASHQSNNTN